MKKRNWDDIDSLELTMEAKYNVSSSDNRRYGRLTSYELSKILFNTDKIYVKIITLLGTYNGKLINISASGILIEGNIPDAEVKLSFFINQRKIFVKGLI